MSDVLSKKKDSNITVYIPKQLHRNFKAATAKQGESMNEVILQHIVKYTKKQSN